MDMIDIERGSIVLEDTHLCATCKRQLVRIPFTINGHTAEVRSCGMCDWRVLSVDGVSVTKGDLLAGMTPDGWVPPAASAAPSRAPRLADLTA